MRPIGSEYWTLTYMPGATVFHWWKVRVLGYSDTNAPQVELLDERLLSVPERYRGRLPTFKVSNINWGPNGI